MSTRARSVIRGSDWWPRAVDWGSAVLSLFVVAGLYADGWAHVNIGGLESFFTPWHAALYGAFSLLAAWVIVAALRGADGGNTSGTGRRAYWLSLVGVGVFVTGGLTDLLWHGAFGIEVGIDALLSPTHLVLLSGGLLMLSTAFRASRPALHAAPAALSWPAVLSLTAVAALCGFFLSYVSAFGEPGAVLPLTRIPEGVPGHQAAELPAVAGLGGYLVTTVLLVVTYVHGRRVGRFPRGGLTILVAGVAIPGAMLTEFGHPWSVVFAVLGAAVADLAVGSRSVRVVVSAFPGFVWAGHLAGLALTSDLGWPPELWGGVIVLSMLVGAAVGWLIDPPARAVEESRLAAPGVEVGTTAGAAA